MRSITLFEIYRGKLRVPGFGHVITRVPRFCHLIGVLIFIPYDLCDLYTFPIETDDHIRVYIPLGWDICIDCSMICAPAICVICTRFQLRQMRICAAYSRPYFVCVDQ